MSKVSKEMVNAVRMARWEEWERMAKELPGGHHILSVELLRTRHNETAVVLTVVHNHRLVQYELRGDRNGGNPRPVVSHPRKPVGCDDAAPAPAPEVHAVTAMAAVDDGGAIADGIALGDPPPKEDPLPGAIALGSSLLTTTFNLGEQALPDASTPTR